VNIGFACSLLRTDMALYRVTAELPAVVKLEDAGQFAEVRRDARHAPCCPALLANTAGMHRCRAGCSGRVGPPWPVGNCVSQVRRAQ